MPTFEEDLGPSTLPEAKASTLPKLKDTEWSVIYGADGSARLHRRKVEPVPRENSNNN
jgi:hypothetical protein